MNEVWLFHGTSDTAAQAIAKSNFSLPTRAGNFGKGAYFAEAAVKSCSYAKKVESGEHAGCQVMMLCRVVLGNVRHVSGCDQAAERLVVNSGYDSVLGRTDHREFLVYDVSQIYPEYIMFYKPRPN